MLTILFCILSGTFRTFAQDNSAAVQMSQFQEGDYWTWTYSSLEKDGSWSPYFSERYTVSKVDGALVTIEMSSTSYPYTPSPAHHKMVVDFTKCEKASQDAKFKNFTIAFYTKSFGNGWQLVSSSHKNAPFTEKFNCAGTGEATTYFSNPVELAGVQAQKIFPPNNDYKSEFSDFCNLGAACAQN
jgi:hypothetical protein